MKESHMMTEMEARTTIQRNKVEETEVKEVKEVLATMLSDVKLEEDYFNLLVNPSRKIVTIVVLSEKDAKKVQKAKISGYRIKTHIPLFND